ncbi:MAG: hypothetical protein V1792_09810 [Pseudomonadota bacterium]
MLDNGIIDEMVPTLTTVFSKSTLQPLYRFITIDGFVSWQRSEEQAEWYGDLVTFADLNDYEPRGHIYLEFPKSSNHAPTRIHCQQVSVLTFWRNGFHGLNVGALTDGCKVIAVINT